jgi:hypothetical protein
MTTEKQTGLTDEEIRRRESDLIRKLMPEFDAIDVTMLATILELTSIQWITYQVVKKKTPADQINDMIFSVVYRLVETFPDFEKEIMKQKLMDEVYLSPVLQEWLSQKAEFMELIGE